jgi:hypothetical protein
MKKVLILISVLLFANITWADSYDYESITVSTTAIGVTASKLSPSNSEKVKILTCSAETAQMRFRIDGTDPTSAEGHLIEIGDILTIGNYKDISLFKAIRTGGTNGVLKCTFER